MTVLRVNTIAGIGTTTFGPTFGGNLEFNSQNYIVLPKGSSTQQGVLRDIPDVVGTGGTFYDNLVLAMPFNQANGLRDVSSRNRNPGAYGNVSISSTISKYYGSSAKFDGSGDYLELVGVGSDFAYDNGNYTMETWFYPSVSISSNTILIDQRNYKKKINKVEVETLEENEEHTYNIDDLSQNQKLIEFVDAYVDYCTQNIFELFPKGNDAQVADAILELFRKREHLDVFNKKALYIYIREMVDIKTPKITKVANQLHDIFKKGYMFYLEHGYTNF